MDLSKRTDEMRSFFNRVANINYDEVHTQMLNCKTPIAAALPENTQRILDLGAGTGLELTAVFERFPNVRVTAIDVSEDMLAILSRRPFADRVAIRCADFFEADFGQDYDAVISSAALHHFEESVKARLYTKIYASLRPGGVFINSDKCAESQEQQDMFFREFERDGHNHSHFDTPLTAANELKLLQQAGFQSAHAEPIPDTLYSLLTAQKP